MKTILPKFTANEESLIILPSKQIEFSSIVKQMDETLHVAQTPMEIIKESCVKYNSTYDGRRKAMMSNTCYRRNVPTALCDRQDIYFFPTHAINDKECCWVFYDNILTYKRHRDNNREQVEVTFINGSKIVLDISMHTFERQMFRTYTARKRQLARYKK